MAFNGQGHPVHLVDERGIPYGIKEVDGKPRVSCMPYPYDIAEGNISDHAYFRGLGYNADVDNAEEDLWSVGGAYVFPTAGMGMEVVSSSGDDDSAGTGARTVMLHYLDDSYAEQTETVTMDGETPVATDAKDILRINQFHVVTVGTGGMPAGNIDVRHLSDTPVYSRIIIGVNMALQAIWTVPAAKTAYIVAWHGGVGHQTGNRFARFLLKVTASLEGVLNAGVFQPKDILIVQDGSLVVPFHLPVVVPAQADIKISVISDNAAANALCAGHFEGWYES